VWVIDVLAQDHTGIGGQTAPIAGAGNGFGSDGGGGQG
jgi:hypothetical protein